MSQKTKPKVPKRSAGLVIKPPSPRPAGDSPGVQLFREAKEQAAAVAPTQNVHHPPPTHHPPTTHHPIAPEKNYARVPNSVALEAIPAGMFRGESLKTYQALYQRTRGAVAPRRAIRATLAEVMDWAGVSHNTLKAHLKHLTSAGLIVVHYRRGDNHGPDYEVFTPEECAATTHHPPPTTHPPTTNQILGGPTTQNVVGGGWGEVVDLSTTSGNDNTSFKTNTERSDDDEAFAALTAVLKQAAKRITGKPPSATEAERWRELGELLATELQIAAGRTTVSNVPAFLTEHLRRRLWKKEKRQVEAERAEATTEEGPAVDASQCPDCFGTGMYYPQGFERGVARCQHEKLTAGEVTPN